MILASPQACRASESRRPDRLDRTGEAAGGGAGGPGGAGRTRRAGGGGTRESGSRLSGPSLPGHRDLCPFRAWQLWPSTGPVRISESPTRDCSLGELPIGVRAWVVAIAGDGSRQLAAHGLHLGVL